MIGGGGQEGAAGVLRLFFVAFVSVEGKRHVGRSHQERRKEDEPTGGGLTG